MSFSYNSLLQTPLDRVRHALADTVDPGFRSDEMIESLLTTNTELKTIAILAEGLYAEYALLPDSISIPGGPSISFRSRLNLWKTLAENGGTTETGGGSTDSTVGSGTPERAGYDYVDTEYYRYRLGENMRYEGGYWVDSE